MSFHQIEKRIVQSTHSKTESSHRVKIWACIY